MRKIASIDIGTNSVLYSLFEIAGRRDLTEIHFARHSPQIGEKLKGARKPRISDKSYQKLSSILKTSIRHALEHGAEEVLIAGTNPFRLAENGRAIKERLDHDLGIPTTILSPNREACLSFLGAVGNLRSNQTAAVIDLGGGSTELIVYRGQKRQAFVSLPEGAVSLTEKFASEGAVDPNDFDRFRRGLARYKKRADRIKPYLKSRVILVGGTSSALALLKDPDFLKIKRNVVLTTDDLELFVGLLAGLNSACRKRLLKFDKKRAGIIFAGAFWLGWVFKVLDLRKAEATPRGLRHGLVLDRLNRPFTS